MKKYYKVCGHVHVVYEKNIFLKLTLKRTTYYKRVVLQCYVIKTRFQKDRIVTNKKMKPYGISIDII